LTSFNCISPLQVSKIDAGRSYFCSRSALAADHLQIRSDEQANWPKVWTLLEPVFRAGETFGHDPAITKDVALAASVKQSQAVMVAADTAGSLLGAGFGKVGLDQVDQHLPWHHGLHLRQKSLPLGALFSRGLRVITKAKLLADHQPSPYMQSQAYFAQVGWVFQRLPYRHMESEPSW
jgi:hypothetical protein